MLALLPLVLRTPALLGLALLAEVSAVPAQAPSSTAGSAQYLKSGDPVIIHMRGVPSAITMATYVQRGGSIEVAPAGTIQVDGLSAAAAAQQVKAALEAHFPRPGVVLTPIDLGRSMFYITGDVRNPGAYPATQGLTVRQAVRQVAGDVTFWCPHPWYLRLTESCAARVSIVRPDAQGNLDFLSTQFTDWLHSGTETVRAGDLLTVHVVLDHSHPN